MVNTEPVLLVLAACIYHLEAVACVLDVLCVFGGETGGDMGQFGWQDMQISREGKPINGLSDKNIWSLFS